MSAMTRGPDGTPWAFSDLPIEAFPVTLEGYLVGTLGTRELLWTRTAEPYTVVDVPAVPEHAGKVAVKLTFADGTVVWQEPVSPEEAEAYIEERIKDTRGG